MTTMLRNLVLAFALLLAGLATADAASRFAVCSTTCTWDGSSTAMWSASSGGATGASVPGSSDSVTLDAATCVGGTTCTITVNTNVAVTTFTMGACTASTTGCILDFSVNNNSVTLTTSFNGSGTGTRTLRMGDGTWTISGTSGNPWTVATTTNMTFTKNAANIVFNLGNVAATQTFSGGGFTYNGVTINSNATAGAPPFAIAGTNTFGSLTVNGVNTIQFPVAVTTTISTAFTWTGTSSLPIGALSGTPGVTATVSVPSGTSTMTWAYVRDLTFTGGGSFSASNSLNGGHNTGITITAPSAGGGCGGIIGGWLLDRDFPPANDNRKWLNPAANYC